MLAGSGFAMLGLVALVAIAIAMICVRWMQSTRASQRRVDQQNERIIELLERIVEEGRNGRTGQPAGGHPLIKESSLTNKG